MSRLSIVVPVYNNARSLAPLLQRFQELALRNPEDNFEYVFVDDGSSDDSYEVLIELSKEDDRVSLVKLSRNFGSNAAILAGLEHSTGAAVTAIAADLQDPPELIDKMIEHWRNGTKVVLAARKNRDDPALTEAAADIFYSLFRRFAIRSMPKKGFDFFLIDRQVCDLLVSIEENNTYLMGLILWLGYRPVVISYNRQAREKTYGPSMWTFSKRIKYFIDSFVAFSYFPIRISSIIGILFSVLALLYAVVIIVLWITSDFDARGWASTMLVLLVTSGIQMVMLGVLGEYIWRGLEASRRRPPYVVDETNKFSSKSD